MGKGEGEIMIRLSLRRVGVCLVALMLALMPLVAMAQTEEPTSNPPPVSQPLVNEGTLAVKLVFALAVGSTEDEIEAESILGDLGIAPRNGWIADYPVTPDIVAEVRNSVAAAADADRLSMAAEDALKQYDDTLVAMGLRVRVYSGEPAVDKPVSCENYPNPAMVTTTYTSEGPPVVTYYCPPPDYYYLYTWVPYPFWWYDFWYPGFFVLRDFHRVVYLDRRVVVVSNHYRDVRKNRVIRVDPIERYRGRTYAGIGAPHRRDYLSTGVPQSSRRIFNEPRGGRTPAVQRGTAVGTAPRRSGSSVTGTVERRTVTPTPRSGVIPAPRVERQAPIEQRSIAPLPSGGAFRGSESGGFQGQRGGGSNFERRSFSPMPSGGGFQGGGGGFQAPGGGDGGGRRERR